MHTEVFRCNGAISLQLPSISKKNFLNPVVSWIVSPKEVCWRPKCTCEYDIIWKWGLCRGNQVKVRSYWIKVGLKYNDQCPYREREIWRHKDTQEWRPSDGRGRDWSLAAISQETPRISNKHQKLDDKHETGSPSEPPGGTCSAILLWRS